METVENLHRNVTVVRMPINLNSEKRILLTADRHWDNPQSNWKLQHEHLVLARYKKAKIIDIGDFFCAMQGKYDKRASKSKVRPEHRVDDYLDTLVDTAADFFEKWADMFITIGMGNHETSILNKHETNLTDRLVKELNRRRGTQITNGGYSGWIKFIFDFHGQIETKNLWYIHGYGGGGPVTKGVIQTNRRAVYLPDADVVISGHIHEDWNLKITRVRCPDNGIPYLDTQLHIQVPTYKDEYGDGYGGWHVETGKPPKPVGATWLVFRKKKKDAPITCHAEEV